MTNHATIMYCLGKNVSPCLKHKLMLLFIILCYSHYLYIFRIQYIVFLPSITIMWSLYQSCWFPRNYVPTMLLSFELLCYIYIGLNDFVNNIIRQVKEKGILIKMIRKLLLNIMFPDNFVLNNFQSYIFQPI